MPTREEAINAIHTERNYQDAKYPGRRALGEHVKLVQVYAQKLSKPGADVTDVMREIAAIATRAMEEYDAPMRNIHGEMHAIASGDALGLRK